MAFALVRNAETMAETLSRPEMENMVDASRGRVKERRGSAEARVRGGWLERGAEKKKVNSWDHLFLGCSMAASAPSRQLRLFAADDSQHRRPKFGSWLLLK